MSYSQTSRVQTCMCSTLKTRFEHLKLRKSQKQELYEEVLKKYGKNSKAQQVLLSTFQSPHSSLSLADIEKKLNKLQSLSVSSNLVVETPKKVLNEPKTMRLKFQSRTSQPAGRMSDEQAWASIVKHDSDLYLREEYEKSLRNNENKEKLKRILAQQVNDRNQRWSQEQNQNLRYDQEQAEFWKAQKNKEKLMEKEIKIKTQEQRKIMNQYMGEVRQRKVQEFISNKDYEANLVSKIQSEMQKDQKEKFDKTEKVKQMYLAVIKENQEKSRLKSLQAIEEKKQDMMIMNEYTKMLDKQEQDRIDYLKNRENRVQTAIIPSSWNALETVKGKNRDEDAQIYKAMQDQFLRLKKREDKEMQNKANQAKELKKFYELQANEKIKKRQKEFESEVKIMQDVKKDNENFKKWNEEKMNKERELRQLHANYLKMQMEEKNL